MRHARDHDVQIAAGTDLGGAIHLAWRDHTLAKELRYLVERGRYEPIDALRSATALAAGVAGRADWIGSIGPGKDADLAVGDGDPTTDIGLLERPRLANEIRQYELLV